MKLLKVGAAIAALAVAGLAANAAQAAVYSTTFQGATFTVTTTSATDFTFQIQGADALTGNWTGAQYLGAFSFSDVGGAGLGLVADLITPAGGDPVTVTGGLDAGGCNGNGAGFYCFDFNPNLAVASNIVFNIHATSGTLAFLDSGPHLKIAWTNSPVNVDGGDPAVGNLFSQSIPGGAVPEPATWAMLIFGFGLVGAGLRLRRRPEFTPA